MKYQMDKEYRQKKIQQQRARRTEAYKEASNKTQRDRYKNDESYRERKKLQSRNKNKKPQTTHKRSAKEIMVLITT
jgi:hypothetical protein